MKGSRFTEEQIIGVLREQEAGARTEEVCRRHGISSCSFPLAAGRLRVGARRKLHRASALSPRRLTAEADRFRATLIVVSRPLTARQLDDLEVEIVSRFGEESFSGDLFRAGCGDETGS
jgi:hypothetical protein